MSDDIFRHGWFLTCELYEKLEEYTNCVRMIFLRGKSYDHRVKWNQLATPPLYDYFILCMVKKCNETQV